MDRETGVSHGYLALAGGSRRQRDRATGRTAAATPTRPSSISYMEEGLVLLLMDLYEARLFISDHDIGGDYGW